MVDLVCIRGEGDHPGQDLIEPLLSDISAALERGRVELDEGALADEISIETPVLDRRLGEIVQVADSMLGTWRGKITSVKHEFSIDDSGNLSGSSSFTVRKPR